jgi:uncharacterized protein (DUF486 family)
MSAEYAKFIPIIAENPFTNAVILTCVPALLYTAAAYAHLAFAGLTLTMSILISVAFATLEYIVRVPIINYSSEVAGMSNGTMQMVWVIITLIFGYVSDVLIPPKNMGLKLLNH